MRVYLSFILALVPLFSFGCDKPSLINAILKQTKVDTIVFTAVADTKKELRRLYPSLTKDILENDFADVFKDYEKHLLAAYALSYDDLSYEELNKLYEFYQSSTGKWILELSSKRNENVQNHMLMAQQIFNTAFINRFNDKGLSAY